MAGRCCADTGAVRHSSPISRTPRLALIIGALQFRVSRCHSGISVPAEQGQVRDHLLTGTFRRILVGRALDAERREGPMAVSWFQGLTRGALTTVAIVVTGCSDCSPPRTSLEPGTPVIVPGPSAVRSNEERYAGSYVYAGNEEERAAIRK